MEVRALYAEGGHVGLKKKGDIIAFLRELEGAASEGGGGGESSQPVAAEAAAAEAVAAEAVAASAVAANATVQKKPSRKVLSMPPLSGPPLGLVSEAEEDPRLQHPLLLSTPASDMDITFLGTASCNPSFTRGVSCTALRINDNNRTRKSASESAHDGAGTWLFDAGEGTQLKLQQSPITKSKITKVFVTHCHGDHSFGLPGLLCMLGVDRVRAEEPPIDIYGPEGLRDWLRATIRYTTSRVCPNYRVHELKDVPLAPGWAPFYRGNAQRKQIGG